MGFFHSKYSRSCALSFRSFALLACVFFPLQAQAFTLPDTGQTQCFDNTQQIECPTSSTADFYGQDAQFLGAPLSYTDNGNGTVTDNNTGLIWQQTPDRSGLTWANATSYCESLTFAGQSDWRLPSRREIATLTNYNRNLPTFPYLLQSSSTNESDWTSTTYINDTTEAYALASGGAYMELHTKDTSSSSLVARCVRGDALPAFTPSVDGETITDTTTGLMWTANSVTTGTKWKEALNYCATLGTGSHTDWRLPNITELYSLFDDTKTYPALPNGFSNVGNPPIFWSGTSQVSSPEYAMVMGVNDEGRSFRWSKTTGLDHNEFPMVICVRSGPSLAPTLGTYAPGAVTAPVSGASLYWAENSTIQWNTAAITGATVDLYAINDALDQISDSTPDATLVAKMAAVKFASGVANAGSYEFSPIALNILGSKTKLLVVSNTGQWGLSQGNCTVAQYAIPTALDATDVTTTGFKANWSTTPSATAYLLSVYDKTASKYVSGFNNLNVGNVTSYTLTGLTPGHLYRYVVKSVSSVGTSGISNVIEVHCLVDSGATSTLLLLSNEN